MKEFTPEIRLIFSVFGDELDPQEFSKFSELTPTATWSKGDPLTKWPNIEGEGKLTKKETCWELTLGPVHAWSVEDQIADFIKNFSPRSDVIAQYIQEKNLESTVNLVVSMEQNKTPAIYFDTKFLDLVNKLRSEIGFDLYVN